VGLSDSPPVLEAPPNREVDRCLELRWAPRRARVGVVGTERRRSASWDDSLDAIQPVPCSRVSSQPRLKHIFLTS
jgi:hypothetical protein